LKLAVLMQHAAAVVAMRCDGIPFGCRQTPMRMWREASDAMHLADYQACAAQSCGHCYASAMSLVGPRQYDGLGLASLQA